MGRMCVPIPNHAGKTEGMSTRRGASIEGFGEGLVANGAFFYGCHDLYLVLIWIVSGVGGSIL